MRHTSHIIDDDRRMTATALGLILVAAVLHALWNLLAKQAGGGPAFVWIYGTTSALLLLPFAVGAFAVQRPELTLVGMSFTLGSAVLHAVYFIVLQQAYREGDLSVVYPVARGTGPVLSTIAAIIALGERPSVLALCGAALVALSVFALARPARAKAVDTKKAIIFGLVTGVLIAGYTVCDKQAVGPYRVPPLIQQWGASLGLTVFLSPFALHRRDEVRRHLRHHRGHVLAIGALVPMAYILVLSAMRFTPISYIAPAREVSILIGTIMGTHFLSEGQSRKRIAAAVTMVIGVAALALG
jgi:drug/metabolite transporter (DMT)-like permease